MMAETRIKNIWAVVVAAACLLALSATAHSAEKIKGTVVGVYEKGTFCQALSKLVEKEDVCAKGADRELQSIVTVVSEKGSVAPEKDQKILVKFKGAGKSTGRLITTVEEGVSKEDLEKVAGKGSVILWKMGEKGPLLVIEAKELMKPDKDASAKLILKKKAPKVEGC